MRCFTSDLLTSAVDGHVRIDREDRVLRSDLWRLQRIDGGAETRFPTAAALMAELFPAGASSLELKKKNSTLLTKAWLVHAQSLKERLHGSHFKRNVGSIVLAVVIGIVTAAVALGISGGGGVPLIIGIVALMALVVVVFGRLVEAPTLEGRKLLDEIAGLKLYLGVAERDELAGMQGPNAPPPLDAARYEMLLPYAVALDVEEAWTTKFTAAVGAAAAAEATSRMAWYHGAGANDLGGMVKAVSSGLSTSIASASTPPGSSSGSGGGGFSGGGGGGGGGGGR
jgi:uncharacterized membrane protein YgcG